MLHRPRRPSLALVMTLAGAAWLAGTGARAADGATSSSAAAYRIDTIAEALDHPWSLAVLPDGRLLVTERAGRLRVIERDAAGAPRLRAAPVEGVPTVLARGQSGLFDVLLDPDFASNGLLYLSFAHGTPAANHLRVVRARFDGTRLEDIRVQFT